MKAKSLFMSQLANQTAAQEMPEETALPQHPQAAVKTQIQNRAPAPVAAPKATSDETRLS